MGTGTGAETRGRKPGGNGDRNEDGNESSDGDGDGDRNRDVTGDGKRNQNREGRTPGGNGNGSGNENEGSSGDGDGDENGIGIMDVIETGEITTKKKGRGGREELWCPPHQERSRVKGQALPFRARHHHHLCRQEMTPEGIQQLLAQDPAPA